MKAKPQTGDPGENHSNGNTGTMGMADFSGQDSYDDRSEEGVADDTEVPVRVTNTSNPCNGSGGSRKTISPSSVKGSNP